MFAYMISELEKGDLPDTKLLRKRFDGALVKKMALTGRSDNIFMLRFINIRNGSLKFSCKIKSISIN